MKILNALKTLVSRKGWSKKQRRYRLLCRLDDEELERFINWAELPRTPQELQMTIPATPVPTTPEETKEGASTGPLGLLPDEFRDSGDPKGDACCYQGCRSDQ